jgi:hypothetical protein
MLDAELLDHLNDRILKMKILNTDDKFEKYLFVQITYQNIFYNNRECKILNIRDVTALKQLAKAEEDNRLTQLLTASVSHELITPLKCIGSFAKELQTLLVD